MRVIAASHPDLGEPYLACQGEPKPPFTANETNKEARFGTPNRTPFVTDGINNHLVHGAARAMNPELAGTKGAAHYQLTIPADYLPPAMRIANLENMEKNKSP